jgi:hypothetical protein
MSTLSRPPRDIAPGEFFATWLPEQYKQLKTEQSSDAVPPDGSISITLEGDGGGAWTMAMVAGDLTVTEGTAADSILSLTQTVEDWRTIIAGDEPEGGAGLPANIDFAKVFSDPTALDLFKDVKGTIKFEIPNFKGRTFAVTIMFNGTAEPAAGVSVDAETIAAIRAGEMAPPQAFFAGKIQLTGDTTLAMQLGMAMAARQG